MLSHPTIEKLRTMRLMGMVNALEDQLQTPDIKDLSFEERLGLFAPDAQADIVDEVHENLDIDLIEATTEIAGRRRVGNPLGPQGVQVHLVVAP